MNKNIAPHAETQAINSTLTKPNTNKPQRSELIWETTQLSESQQRLDGLLQWERISKSETDFSPFWKIWSCAVAEKVVIVDGMNRQDNDSDRRRTVIRSQKQRQSRKKKPKKLDLGIWHWPFFFKYCAVHLVYNRDRWCWITIATNSKNHAVARCCSATW